MSLRQGTSNDKVTRYLGFRRQNASVPLRGLPGQVAQYNTRNQCVFCRVSVGTLPEDLYGPSELWPDLTVTNNIQIVVSVFISFLPCRAFNHILLVFIILLNRRLSTLLRSQL